MKRVAWPRRARRRRASASAGGRSSRGSAAELCDRRPRAVGGQLEAPARRRAAPASRRAAPPAPRPEPVALPDREVGVLDRQRRQRRRLPRQRRRRRAPPARARSTPIRPAVRDDVVEGEEQGVLVVPPSRSRVARSSGPRARSKRRPASRPASAAQLRLPALRRQAGEVDERQRCQRARRARSPAPARRRRDGEGCAAPRGGARPRRGRAASAAGVERPAQAAAPTGML